MLKYLIGIKMTNPIIVLKLSRMMKMKTSETGKEKQKRPTGGYKRRRRK